MAMVGLMGTVRAVMYMDSSQFRTGCEGASKTFAESMNKLRMDAQRMSITGAALGAAVTIPLSMFSKAASRSSATFELEMIKVKNVARMTEGQIQTLSKSVMDMSKNYSTAPSEIAKGAYTVAQAAIVDPRMLTKVTEQATAMQVATGFEVSVERSAELLGTLINAFNVPLQDVESLMDKVVRTQQLSVASWEELISNLGKASGVYSQTFENKKKGLIEMMALIATVTQGGEKADRAATGVRNILTRIMKEGGKEGSSINKMAQFYGYKNAIKMVSDKGVIQTLQHIGEYAGTSTEEFMQLKFQARELTSALLSMRKEGKTLLQIEEEITKSFGAQNDSIEGVRKSQKMLFDSFSATKQRALISFGDSFKEIWASMIPVINSLLEAIIKIPAPFKRLIAITAIISGLASSLMLLQGAWKSLKLVAMMGSMGKFVAAFARSRAVAGATTSGVLGGMFGAMAQKASAPRYYTGGMEKSVMAGITNNLHIVSNELKRTFKGVGLRSKMQEKFWTGYGAWRAGTPLNKQDTMQHSLFAAGKRASIDIPGVGLVFRKDVASRMGQGAIQKNMAFGEKSRLSQLLIPSTATSSFVATMKTFGAKLAVVLGFLTRLAGVISLVIVAFEAFKVLFKTVGDQFKPSGSGEKDDPKSTWGILVKELSTLAGWTQLLKSLFGALLQIGNVVGTVASFLFLSLVQVLQPLFDSLINIGIWVRNKWKDLTGRGWDNMSYNDIGAEFDENSEKIGDLFDDMTANMKNISDMSAGVRPDEPGKPKKTPAQLAAEAEAESQSAWQTAHDQIAPILEDWNKANLELWDLTKAYNDEMRDLDLEEAKPINDKNEGWAKAMTAGSVESWNQSMASYIAERDLLKDIRDQAEEVAIKRAAAEEKFQQDRVNAQIAMDKMVSLWEMITAARTGSSDFLAQ